jgi:hypothetical protein
MEHRARTKAETQCGNSCGKGVDVIGAGEVMTSQGGHTIPPGICSTSFLRDSPSCAVIHSLLRPDNLDRTMAAEAETLSPFGIARSTVKGSPLSQDELRKTDAYMRASLYLCLGMLYLKKNPLLKEALTLDHIKSRLLGHWGSDAGQIFTYIHFNRLIKKYGVNALFISGPGESAYG